MNPQEFLEQSTQYLKSLEEMKRKSVAIGILGEDGGETYEDGATLVQIGAIHEYGLGNPERSFIKMPTELKQKDIARVIGVQFNKTLEGQGVDKSLGLLGVYVQNVIKGAFTSDGYGKWPPLSAITVAKKGSSKPLIDTGRLMNSIHYEIRR